MKKGPLSSILVATMLLAVEVIADAQQPGKVFRIGFLDESTPSGSAVLVEAFRQELSKLGWRENRSPLSASNADPLYCGNRLREHGKHVA